MTLPPPRHPDRAERHQRAVARLLRFYRPRAGRFRPARGEAWQLALAIEAVATAYEQERRPAHLAALTGWLARHGARRSRFFDDDGWYVNAWLRAYDVTRDAAFLAAARTGFADLLPGWDDVCGGGLWWSHDRTYKNAITTELFLLAAAGLASHYPDQGYDEWADRAAVWIDHSGLINVDGLVNDGLDRCVNNGGPTWTYNQGVLLSGLAQRWRATGEPWLIERAHTVARATISRLVDGDGILREPCEITGTCDRDQLIFKGIFAVGLARLWSVDPDPAYVAFLVGNADSVWQRARDRRDGLGLSWAGPPRPVTAASHASGTLLLGAALAVQ